MMNNKWILSDTSKILPLIQDSESPSYTLLTGIYSSDYKSIVICNDINLVSTKVYFTLYINNMNIDNIATKHKKSLEYDNMSLTLIIIASDNSLIFKSIDGIDMSNQIIFYIDRYPQLQYILFGTNDINDITLSMKKTLKFHKSLHIFSWLYNNIVNRKREPLRSMYIKKNYIKIISTLINGIEVDMYKIFDQYIGTFDRHYESSHMITNQNVNEEYCNHPFFDIYVNKLHKISNINYKVKMTYNEILQLRDYSKSICSFPDNYIISALETIFHNLNIIFKFELIKYDCKELHNRLKVKFKNILDAKRSTPLIVKKLDKPHSLDAMINKINPFFITDKIKDLPTLYSTDSKLHLSIEDLRDTMPEWYSNPYDYLFHNWPCLVILYNFKSTSNMLYHPENGSISKIYGIARIISYIHFHSMHKYKQIIMIPLDSNGLNLYIIDRIFSFTGLIASIHMYKLLIIIAATIPKYMFDCICNITFYIIDMVLTLIFKWEIINHDDMIQKIKSYIGKQQYHYDMQYINNKLLWDAILIIISYA